MSSFITFFPKLRFKNVLTGIALIFLTGSNFVFPQPNRIHFAGRDIFLSGINIAWSSGSRFARDLGPDPVDVTTFTNIFKTVHDNGGNVLRLWLHTNGANTPEYNASGYVTGPGSASIQNLKQILTLAKQNDVQLILTLWSFDMLRVTELDAARLNANIKMLTDTSYTMAYVRNALMPLVEAVKGDSAIFSWEVCNEPNGMTTGMNYYPADPTVSPEAVQQFTNLLAGGIHRADSNAYVTTGPGSFQTVTDVNTLGKLSKFSQSQLKEATEIFNASHREAITAAQMSEYLNKISAIANTNLYRDERLIAAGGDSLGTLDFYAPHYYNYGSSALSPLTHTLSYWQLDKPVAIGEFWMQTTDGIASTSYYSKLFENNYAGALAWSWTDFPNTPNNKLNAATDTWENLKYMFANYREDILIYPKTGTIYVFNANQQTLEKTDSTLLRWDVEPGSVVKLNGRSVNVKDSVYVKPLVTTVYALTATGMVSDSETIDITVLPTGRILEFRASPPQIGAGENTWLIWHVVKGSAVTLNGNAVPALDTLEIFPTASDNTYTLVTRGDENDSLMVTVQIFPPNEVNRAYHAPVTASSNDTVAYSFSKPENIVDGNNISRWQAAAAPAAQSVQLDLGRIDSIKKIIIRWGNKAYAKQYSVQASNDLVSWSVVKSVLNGTGGTNFAETLDNLSSVGRYLTFLLQSQGSGAYSIAEIYVYGAPANTTGVAIDPRILPFDYSLSQNYPNPFNPTTTINFGLPKSSNVKLIVYNLLGQQIATIVDSYMEAGYKSVRFNASGLSSGMYFYRLEAGDFVSNKKMLLIK